MRRSLARLAESTSARVKSINDIQKLYYIHSSSPGSVFFLPKGTKIVSKLSTFMRAQMRINGFHEVMSPQLFKKELWQQSGHWDHYKDDMFSVSGGCCDHGAPDTSAEDQETFSLKPMNCPGHCLIFKSQERSFRDLPIRFSDFSPLHRNEASGALTGLTRVRRFHQDDGHIFCRPDQVSAEISKSLNMVDQVYGVFGLKYSKVLSTRPESYIGELEIWNQAEDDLRNVLGPDVIVNEGDGAFYGPKIDFVVTDNLGREHQAATIQLDFQLPRKFELKYDDDNMNTQVPVMIHRAIFGSVERFLALLIDHYEGKWPFWMNPLQAVVVPVSQSHVEYAQKVARVLGGVSADALAPLNADHYDVEVYSQSEPMGGRIRRAIENAASYVVVVGDKEVENGTISVRNRDEGRKQVSMSVDELLNEFRVRSAKFS